MKSLLKSLLTFIRLPIKYKLLAFIILFELTKACLELKFKTFETIAGSLGQQKSESSHKEHSAEQLQYERLLKRLIQRIANLVPWRCVCFPQAIAAQRLLNKREIANTLYLGLKKDNAELKAHAWVRAGTYIVTGGANNQEFTVINSFTHKPHD